MTRKKHFIKQLFSTFLISATILIGSSNVNAAFCDYEDNNDNVLSSIVCDGLDIYGTSTTVFEGVVTNNTPRIDIYDSAAPVFNNNVISNAEIRIWGTGNPVFNGHVQTGGSLRILTSEPIFNGNVQVAEILRISGTSAPIFNGDVQVVEEIQVIGDVKPVFSGNVTASEMQFIDNDDAEVRFTDGSTLDVPVTVGLFGRLIFEGDTTIHQFIGTAVSPLDTVTFSSNDPAKTATLRSDIYSSEIHLGGLNINVDKNIKLVSTDFKSIHLNNTIFTLNSNTLFHSGNVQNDVAGKITIQDFRNLRKMM